MSRLDKNLLLLVFCNLINILLRLTIKNNVNINLLSKINLITQLSAFLSSRRHS